MSQMRTLHLFIRTETVRASGAARSAAIAIDDALSDMGAHVPADEAIAKAERHDQSESATRSQQLHRALAHLHQAQGVRAAVSQDPEPFDGLRVVA